jgi:acyl-CoA thioester hydrolase
VSDYSADAPRLVLKSVAVEYRAPMFLGEEYIVTGRTASFRNSSFVMEYAVFSDGLRVEGSAVAVLLTQDESGKAYLSDAAREAMITRDGARDDR